MLVITRENNRIEREVNIGCNHSHKVTLLCFSGGSNSDIQSVYRSVSVKAD